MEGDGAESMCESALAILYLFADGRHIGKSELFAAEITPFCLCSYLEEWISPAGKVSLEGRGLSCDLGFVVVQRRLFVGEAYPGAAFGQVRWGHHCRKATSISI